MIRKIHGNINRERVFLVESTSKCVEEGSTSVKRREENLNNRTMKAKGEQERGYVSKNMSVNSCVESSFLEETSCNSLEKLLP